MSPRDHLNAAITLLAMAWMLVSAGPLTKPLRAEWIDTAQERDKLAARHGAWVPAVIAGGLWVDTHLREPLDGWLRPTQQFLGMEQGYGVYPSTAGRMRVFEIHVDDALVYRSQDPDHAWHHLELATRKVRPLLLEVVDKGSRARNFQGFVRYLRTEVQQDFPDAQRLDLYTLVGAYPGTELRQDRWIRLEAPGWRPDVRLDGPTREPADAPDSESNL